MKKSKSPRRFKLSDEYENWVSKARPILLDIFYQRKKELDGFQYAKSAPEAGNNFRLRLRNDGNFDVFTGGSFEDTNGGKGFTAEDIVYGDSYYGLLWNPYLSLAYDTYYPLKQRKDMIKEIKRKTGIDLRKEIQKRSSS